MQFMPAIGSRVMYECLDALIPYLIIGYKEDDIAIIKDMDTGHETWIIVKFFKYDGDHPRGYRTVWNERLTLLD